MATQYGIAVPGRFESDKAAEQHYADWSVFVAHAEDMARRAGFEPVADGAVSHEVMAVSPLAGELDWATHILRLTITVEAST